LILLALVLVAFVVLSLPVGVARTRLAVGGAASSASTEQKARQKTLKKNACATGRNAAEAGE